MVKVRELVGDRERNRQEGEDERRKRRKRNGESGLGQMDFFGLGLQMAQFRGWAEERERDERLKRLKVPPLMVTYLPIHSKLRLLCCSVLIVTLYHECPYPLSKSAAEVRVRLDVRDKPYLIKHLGGDHLRPSDYSI